MVISRYNWNDYSISSSKMRILDPVSKCGQLRTAPAAVAWQVSSVRNIIGRVQVIPELATSSRAGDGRNEKWIVNSHIPLATQNDGYQ